MAEADEAIGPSGAPVLSRPPQETWLTWGAAIGGNLVFFLIFGLVARVTIMPGVKDPGTILPVIVLAEDDLLPAPVEEEEDFTRTAPQPVQTVPEEASAPVAEADALPNVPVPRPAPPAAPAPPLPEVELPEAQAGGPQGVIALRCYELFSDPDKAAECAGRPEVLSGWSEEGSDFSDIARALRREGYDPDTDRPPGPAVPGLPRGTEAFEPFDDGLLIGRAEARRRRNLDRFGDMKDPRSTISEMQSPVDTQFDNLGGAGTVPLFTERWEPSWVLKDNPGVDQKLVDEMMRDLEQSGDN